MINIFEKKKSNIKTVLLYFIVCIFFFILIELIHRQNFESLINFFSQNSLTTILYLLVFFIFTSLYVFLFKKPILACSIHYTVWSVIAFVSSINIYFKGTPLIFEDLFLVSEATNILSKYLNKTLITNIILLSILIILIFLISFKLSKTYNIKFFKSKFSIINLILSIFFIFIYLISVNKLFNYGKSITYTLSDFNLSDTYNKNGFIYSFYKSTDLFFSTMGNSNYDPEKVLEIKEKLKSNNINEKIEPDTNLIVIQLESLFDPTKLKDVEFSQDPLENFHKLSQTNESGEITVPVIGGGTIQTEFEVLTGINIKHLYTRMPYLNLLNKTSVESVPYILNSIGYESTAIHNYFSTFYNRLEAYKNLGFDNFIPVETISSREKNQNFWYKDEILINEIINKIKDTNKKDFIFGVTVESHGPYNTHIDGPINVTSSSLNEKDRIELQNYVNIIRNVDDFVLNLINALNSLNEKYIVVFYSDHLPALGENKSTFSSLDEENQFKTPYLIVQSDNTNKIKIDNKDIHSYDLLYEVLSDLNIEPTIYHRFREKFKNDENFDEYELQLLLDINPKRNNIYDNGEFPYKVPNIKIGNTLQSIDDVVIENNKVIVNGNGFTENSVVYVNGEQVDTKYISNNVLEILNYSPKKKDEFISVILSNKKSPLNISNKFIFNK